MLRATVYIYTQNLQAPLLARNRNETKSDVQRRYRAQLLVTVVSVRCEKVGFSAGCAILHEPIRANMPTAKARSIARPRVAAPRPRAAWSHRSRYYGHDEPGAPSAINGLANAELTGCCRGPRLQRRISKYRDLASASLGINLRGDDTANLEANVATKTTLAQLELASPLLCSTPYQVLLLFPAVAHGRVLLEVAA